MAYDLKRVPEQVTERKSYQQYLDEDTVAPPAHFRDLGDDFGAAVVPVENYVSRAFYERERAMWDRTWQMVCREEHIPRTGDYQVYDIANRSFLVVRTETGAIKAFHNVCLHRGRRLRSEDGHAEQFRCPFHGFAWNVDGSSLHIPCRDEFPDLDPVSARLPEAKVATWAGWVFINPDPQAPPLEDYLAPMPVHYAPYRWDLSYVTLHVGKVLRGNWKVVQEAFMESFHSLYTHPQIMDSIDDFGCQYDSWEAYPHVNRMMVPFAAASRYVADQVDEQAVFDSRQQRGRIKDLNPYRLAPGESARAALGRLKRRELQELLGGSFDHVSDAELIDGWYYNAFPNFMFWGGFGPNMFYRFRPYEDSHELTLMEVGFTYRHREGDAKPAPPPLRILDLETRWDSVPELGMLGAVLDQDTTNMEEIQRGLKATVKPGVQLATYQESRIRAFHQTLARYVAPAAE